MPFYSMEAMLPFSHVVEAKGITENSVYYLHTELEQQMCIRDSPHSLHMYGNIQLIEIRLFFVQGDDFQHMVAKNRMPVFRIIDMHGTYGKILYDRIYIFGTNRTLKEAVDQLGIKGDRKDVYKRQILLW